MIKVFGKLRIQGTYLNIIKAVYNKSIANSKLNEDRLKEIPLKSETRKGCPLSPYVFNIILEVLARTMRQLSEIKGLCFDLKKKSKYHYLQMI